VLTEKRKKTWQQCWKQYWLSFRWQ